MLTVEQIKAGMKELGYVMLKYVRMSDGSFRFVSAGRSDHVSMVPQDERSKVVSAGTVVLREDRLMWEGYGSMTLGTSGENCASDEPELERLFGVKFTSRY